MIDAKRCEECRWCAMMTGEPVCFKLDTELCDVRRLDDGNCGPSARYWEDKTFGSASLPPVLDACCGSRMMWFDRKHPDVLYVDQRREMLTVRDRSHGKKDGTRTVRIDPDEIVDFRDMPFSDGSFRLVVFDPPHLVRAGAQSWMAAKYGKLGPEWRDDLRRGFAECFRVLEPGGVLVFKWNETQVKRNDVLELTDEQPLFGHTSGRKGLTHWYVFMKQDARSHDPSDSEVSVDSVVVRCREETMRGANIPKTLIHDAGAYARCSYCGRYTDDRMAIGDHKSPRCDCGKTHGWSGSFTSPTADSKWSMHNATHDGRQRRTVDGIVGTGGQDAN